MNDAIDQPPVARRRAETLLLLVSLLLLAAAGLRVAHSIRHDNALNFVSGAWIALATDLSEGIFYRPLVSDDGFGGTRFFPLQFMSHAVLIRFGADPFVAGHFLSIAWTLLLISGIFAFLRRAGASRAFAAAGALLPLASSAVFTGPADIRGDILPAALNIWGLALCIPRRDEDRPSTLSAALLFTLAFAAKVTTVFGAAAACAALFLNGRRAAAVRLAATCAVGYALVLALIYLASGGRIVEIFRACAAGGTGIGYVLQSPVWMISHQLGHDPLGFTIFALAMGILIGGFRQSGRALPSLAMLTTLGITLVIFASPGTSYNHLIDLTVMGVVFLMVQVTHQRLPASAVAGVLAVVAIVGAVQHLDQHRDSRAASRRFEMRRAVELAGEGAGPILSEDPLVPLVAGDRPYVLDSWMIRVMSRKDPSVIGRLNDEIAARKFRAVVLLTDPDRAGGKYLEERVFGSGFVAAMNSHYVKTDQQAGRFSVYLPKS